MTAARRRLERRAQSRADASGMAEPLASSGADPDPHRQWLRQCLAARDAYLEAANASQATALWERFDGLRSKIFTQPATTAEGHLARLMLAADLTLSDVPPTDELLASLLRDAAAQLDITPSSEWEAGPDTDPCR